MRAPIFIGSEIYRGSSYADALVETLGDAPRAGAIPDDLRGDIARLRYRNRAWL